MWKKRHATRAEENFSLVFIKAVRFGLMEAEWTQNGRD
jgi:hypothetical protein